MKLIKLFVCIAVLSASCMQAAYHVIEFNLDPHARHLTGSYNEFTNKKVQPLDSLLELKSFSDHAEFSDPVGFYQIGEDFYFIESTETIKKLIIDKKGIVVGTTLQRTGKTTMFAEDKQCSVLYNDEDRVSVIQANIFLLTKRIQLAENCLEIKSEEESKGKKPLSSVHYAHDVLSNMANIEILRAQLQELNSQLAAMLEPAHSSGGAVGAARRE